MQVTESPNVFAYPVYLLSDEFTTEDYTDADGHRTGQIPDRRNVLIIDGWPYLRDHDVPIDLLWAKGNDS